MNSPASPQPQPKITHDPKNQVLCPSCGGENFRPRLVFFRLPGQIIGSVDVTGAQQTICEACGEIVDVVRAPLRKDVQKFESKPA